MAYQKTSLKIYQDKNGREPFTVWLESLKDIMVKTRIQNRVNRIALGNFGDCKLIKNGIHELRLHFGPGYRVYFGKIRTTIVLLLCGGAKSTQNQDIKKAQIYWEEFKKS